MAVSLRDGTRSTATSGGADSSITVTLDRSSARALLDVLARCNPSPVHPCKRPATFIRHANTTVRKFCSTHAHGDKPLAYAAAVETIEAALKE